MTDKLRDSAQQNEREAFEAWARPVGFYLTRNEILGHYTNIDTTRAWEGWQARAALAQQDAQAVPQGWKLVPVAADIEVRRHLEGKSGADFLLAYADWCRPAAAPTPPAPKPFGWLDRKAVECLQGAELSWMPAWNRPTSSDPVPIFLLPPARATLTDEEIVQLCLECPAETNDWVSHMEYARAVIEAYEIKNGLKP